MRRITLSRARLVAGESCWRVGGEWWRGFECSYGVVIVRAREGAAWMEFHGDDDNLREGGHLFDPGDGQHERVLFNLLPTLHARRLRADERLHIGAVNRGNVTQRVTACTIYNRLGGALVPAFRFDGNVRSVTIRPPILTRPEPLNAWIEVDDGVGRNRVEVLP